MAAYQVQRNKTINGPLGRFIVKGVTCFDGLFVSFESRANYGFRQIGIDPTKTAASGVSEPTYYAASTFGSLAAVLAKLQALQAFGVNLIRVAVEPAIMYASVAYRYSDGNTYPSDPDMLDAIVTTAGSLGMVAQLQNANDAVPTPLNLIFLAWLRDRYASFSHVWINPSNEINCSPGNPNCDVPSAWYAEMVQYMQVLRAGGTFGGPVVIQAPAYGTHVASVVNYLTSDPAFSGDPNLVIGPHFYPGAEAQFSDIVPSVYSNWSQYIGRFAIVIDEIGLSPSAGIRDPLLDPGYGTPSSPAALAKAYNWIADCCTWASRMCAETALSGMTFFTGSWYVPGLGCHDPDSLMRRDGTFSPLGAMLRDVWFIPPARDRSRRSPGRNYLKNPSFTSNQQAFAGGFLANGLMGYDLWSAASDGTTIAVGNGTVNLTGFVRQIIDYPRLAGKVVTVSVEALTGLVLNVYLGPISNHGEVQGAIAPGRGRVGCTLLVPWDASGNLVLTLQSGPGGVTFKNIKMEEDYAITPYVQPEPSVDLTACQSLFEMSDGNEVYAMTADSASSIQRAVFRFRVRKVVVPSVTIVNQGGALAIVESVSTTHANLAFTGSAGQEALYSLKAAVALA